MRGGGGGRGSGRGGDGAKEPESTAYIDNVRAFAPPGTGDHGLVAPDFGYPWGTPLWAEGNFMASTAFASHARAAANRLFAIPDIRSRKTKIREFALALQSGTNEADDVIRLGIYSDRNAYPATLLWASSEITMRYFPEGVPSSRYVACGFVMEPGIPYWLAWCYPAAFGVNSVMCYQGRHLPPAMVGFKMFDYTAQISSGVQGQESIHGGVPVVGWAHDYTYAALPSAFPSTSKITIQASASPNIPAWFASVQSYP